MEMTFQNPQYLWILLLIPFLVVTHIFTLRRNKASAMKFSNFEALERVAKGTLLGSPYKGLLKNKNLAFLLLRILVYALLTFSITGMTVWYYAETTESDFVIAVDSSSSMLAEDMEPNRLEASILSVKSFVDTLPYKTSIALVSFGGTSFVELEQTENREDIYAVLEQIGLKETGGTAIGDAIITSSNLFKTDKPKAIVLLTDGQNNVGSTIKDAVKYAKDKSIMIHTIGVGTEEGGVFANLDVVSKLDNNALEYISSETDGKTYIAKDNQELTKAFDDIASVTIRKLSIDLSWVLLLSAFILLSLEWFLMNTRYRTVP